MKSFTRIILALLFFNTDISFSSKAQSHQTPIAFDHLTVEEGLSLSTVYTTLQDQNGLIWIGTRYGLNRYDGYECRVFLPIKGDKTSLAGPTVIALAEDKKGKIWIGHRDAGISVWDKTKGIFEQFPNKPDSEIDWNKITVRSIHEDSRGWLWVGTAGAGVFVFDENRNKIEHLCIQCQPRTKALKTNFIFDFQEDRQGRIWIAANGRGITVYDPVSRSTTFINSDDALNLNSYEKSLCLDLQGNLWIGTAGSGLYKYDMAGKKFEHFFTDKNNSQQGLSHNIITDIAVDSSGLLWIATDGGGLNIHAPGSKIFQHITASSGHPQSLNTNALYHLMFDRTGNLWISTFNGGINIHKAFKSPFLIHENQNDYGRKGLRSVLALKEDVHGKIWMGTDGGGLFFTDTKKHSIKIQAVTIAGKKFPKPVITCIETDGEDGLWLGTFADGLSYYNTKTQTIRNFRSHPDDENSLSHNNVWAIETDKKGGLWIGTLGGGLNYLSPDKKTLKRFEIESTDPNSITSVQIVDVLLDNNQEYLWVASEDKGLDRLHLASGAVRHYRQSGAESSKCLSSNNLQCLFQDRQGRLWIGTEFNGLNCLIPETGEVRHYDMKNGLPSDMISSLEADEAGNLWIATPKGIVRWNPANNVIIDFGGDANLKSNQYNPRSSLSLKDGRLAFGGTNGFSILLPNNFQLNLHPPKAIFTDLKISGQSVPIGQWKGQTVLNGNLNDPATTVRLSYADRGIIFEFTGTDYTNPDKNKFAYQLIGFDDEWNYPGAGHQRAIYSSLKGGAYLLKVKASNNDNVWGEVKTLVVNVTPPFWETWWFYLLCITAIMAITFLVIRYFLEHQKAVFQEKSFAAEQEILRLKNENLEKEVESKQTQLSASVLQSAHKNQFLADIKAQIQKIELPRNTTQNPELRKVVRAIDQELDQEDYWAQFQLTFNQMHQSFVQQLQHWHPNISDHDNRLCCFIRMGLSNSEIASILNVTINGVEQSKYRLKKKMCLDKDASLNDYIKNL